MNYAEQPRSKQINTRLTVEEHELLRRKCFDEQTTISTYIRRLIQTALSFGLSDGKNKA
jgi:hypothetical protein